METCVTMKGRGMSTSSLPQEMSGLVPQTIELGTASACAVPLEDPESSTLVFDGLL